MDLPTFLLAPCLCSAPDLLDRGNRNISKTKVEGDPWHEVQNLEISLVPEQVATGVLGFIGLSIDARVPLFDSVNPSYY